MQCQRLIDVLLHDLCYILTRYGFRELQLNVPAPEDYLNSTCR